MALETGTYISSLVATNPTATDSKKYGDDHLRFIKSTLLATFPNVTGAMTATHTELNILDGVTSSTAELNILDGVTSSTAELNILDGVTASTAEINQLDGITGPAAAKDGETYSGTHSFEGATITVPDQTYGVAGNYAANVDYVNQAAFQAALPAQTGNNGKYLRTDGTSASWQPVPGAVIYAQNALGGF